MQKPIGMNLNFELGVGYVTFRVLAEGERASGARLGERSEVVVDRGADGMVVGIELLALDPATIQTAQRFAGENGLAFPRGLGSLMLA